MGEVLNLEQVRADILKRELENDLGRDLPGSLNDAIISILTTRGNVHQVPLEAVLYIGKREQNQNKDWEVRFLSPEQEIVTAYTTPTDVILLLLKLAQRVGIDVQSNIA